MWLLKKIGITIYVLEPNAGRGKSIKKDRPQDGLWFIHMLDKHTNGTLVQWRKFLKI